MTTTDVLIVGAGPTGLAAANVLARSGVDFRIVDSTSGPVEETRALVVHAKILELFDKLGLADTAIEEGQKIGGAGVLKRGERVGELAFLKDGQDDRTPYPFALIYEQHRNERLLIRGLGDSEAGIEWNTELLSLTQTPDGASATVRHSDGSGETIEARWIIGADGASSSVRHSLDLDFEGDTYEESLFLADVDMEWDMEPGRVYIDFTREGFYAFFPMPGEGRFRLIGNVPDELEDTEEITAGDVQEVFDKYSGVKTRITTVRWTSIYRIHRRMTERFRVGRVFLVGDAAHVHSPAGGQGMNTGIGDAFNLAWKLGLVVKGEARETLLDSYEAERMPFARAILNGSDRGFSLQVTSNSIAQRLKLFAVPLLFRLISAAPPLRKQAFWFVSQLWTQYRKSPAVEQSKPVKKGPRAGERSPYGFFESGESIFDLFRDTDHHLLVFEGKESDSTRLDVAQEELEELETLEKLLGRYEIPVHIHPIPSENRQLHGRYGVEESSVFLIRPDGHVAYRGRAADVVGLKMYLDRLFVESNAGQNSYTQDTQRGARA